MDVSDLYLETNIFWMAPEFLHIRRLSNEHRYNGSVDVWSLGCVVLQMWTDSRPWEGLEVPAIVSKVWKRKLGESLIWILYSSKP